MDRYFGKKNMTIIQRFFITIVFFSAVIQSGELFLDAQRLYEEKQFESALRAYKQMKEKNSAVLYNMGNCAFYLKKYCNALSYWQRAMKNASYTQRKEIYALRELIPGYTKNEGRDVYWMSELQDLTSGFSVVSLQITFLLFLFLFYYFSIAGFSISTRCIQFFFCIVTVCLMGIKVHDNAPKVVVQEDAKLYVGPNRKYQVVASCRPLQVVDLQRIEDGWCKVCAENISGWIEKENIKKA